MAVRIRLKRQGKIHHPQYRVVVVDSRKKRDGRVIEEIGFYDPNEHPSVIRIQSERAVYWLGVGAQPSDQVKNLLRLTGDWARFKGVKDPVSYVKYKDAEAEAAAKEAAIKEAAAAAEKAKAKAAAEKEEAEAKAAKAAAAKEAEEGQQTPAEEAAAEGNTEEGQAQPEAPAAEEAPAEEA